MGPHHKKPKADLVVVGEGILSRVQVRAKGDAILPALRGFFDERRTRLNENGGDEFRAFMQDRLELARRIVNANGENAPINSEAEFANRFLIAFDHAEKCRARGDLAGAMYHAARAADFARALSDSIDWNTDAIQGRKIRIPREEGQRREAARRRRATITKYAGLQSEAERLLEKNPTLSNSRIAELAGGNLGLHEKPDTLAGYIDWPIHRRRRRKTTDGKLRRP